MPKAFVCDVCEKVGHHDGSVRSWYFIVDGNGTDTKADTRSGISRKDMHGVYCSAVCVKAKAETIAEKEIEADRRWTESKERDAQRRREDAERLLAETPGQS